MTPRNLGVHAAILLLAVAIFSACSTFVAATPVINEMMSSNIATLQDNFGLWSDWVEIYNPNATPVDLGSYSRSTAATNLTLWTFPSTTLGSHQFLLVWCSGKNLVNTSAPLHTNFKIKAGGEPVYLTAPDNVTIVSS